MTTPYKHEPFTDFSQEENRKAFEQALAKVTESLGQTYPLVINGERIETKDKIVSINPAKKDEVVGTVSKAGKEELAYYSELRQAFAVKSMSIQPFL